MKSEGKAMNEKGKGKVGATTQRKDNVAKNRMAPKDQAAAVVKNKKGDSSIITKITGGAYTGMKKRGA